MDKKKIIKTLASIIKWMKRHKEIMVDDESLIYSPVYKTFPLKHGQFVKFHYDLARLFVKKPFVDQKYGQFEEARMFFDCNGDEVIWRWMGGQGYSLQLILNDEKQLKKRWPGKAPMKNYFMKFEGDKKHVL
jgi:hypothetical protein